MGEADLFRQILGVAAVFALMGAALWVLHARGNIRSLRAGRTPASLEILERLRIAPNHTLVLIGYRGRALLVSVHPGGCELLDSSSLHPTVPGGAGL